MLLVSGCLSEEAAPSEHEAAPAALAPTLKRIKLGPEHTHRLVLKRDAHGDLVPSCGGAAHAHAERDGK
ncbi:MAG: hypothetical protein ABW252_00525 [Polyangiales bacterium]